MELISKADVVLALGTRLNPFSTLPGYGIDYWPKNASIIQVDINPDRIGLTKKVTVGISGDAKLVAEQILAKLSSNAGDTNRQNRKDLIHQTKSAWLQKLSSLDHEDDDPGTVWNKEARERDKDRMSPRQAWRAIQDALPQDAIISSDIGNNCAIGNAYPTFEKPRKYLAPGLFGPCGYGFPAILGAKIGCPYTPVIGFAGDGAFGISMNEMSSCAREEWPAITMVIFRNYQWGAEKRNTTLWFDNNFVGTELDPDTFLARAGGRVLNPNAEILFQGPAIRDFAFEFQMIARSETEGKSIRKIIKFLKLGMAPKSLETALLPIKRSMSPSLS